MFEQNNTPKKSNYGLLREFGKQQENSSFLIGENNRRELIKHIKDGKIRK